MGEKRVKDQPQQPVPVMMVPQPLDEDEINLLDLWRVLVREKFLIAATALVCLGVGAIYAFTARPVYESRAVIHIGQINRIASPEEMTENQIEDPDTLTQRLSLKWGNTVRVNPLGKRLQENKSFIEIMAAGTTPQSAFDLAGKVVAQVISEHRQLFDATLKVWQEQLAQMKRALGSMEDTRKSLGNESPTVDLLLGRSNLDYQMTLLAEKKGVLELKLQPGRSYPTRLIRKPVMPQRATSPRKGRILILSLVLGLFLGMLAAFGHDFFRQMRSKSIEA